MRHPLTTRAAGALFATTMLLAACGDDGDELDTSTPAAEDDAGASDDAMDGMDDGETMDDMEHGDADHGADGAHGHDHGSIAVDDWDAIPSVEIATLVADPKAGANLQVAFENWTIVPEDASTEPVEGEGHFHVYVDGEKIARAYEEWLHLDLEPGTYEVEVELSANDHSTLTLDGEELAVTQTIEVPESDGGHSHGDDVFEAGDPAPGISVEVFEDPESGYNVHVETTDFTFAPEKASTMDTESGEGHAHLYVNGKKITRLYGNWFHYGGVVVEGDNEFRVELSANSHAPYAVDGEVIEAIATVTADEASGTMSDDHDHDSDDHDHGDAVDASGDAAVADQVVEVRVVDGAVEGGGRIEVALGDTVAVVVASDVTDEIHVHGYDLFADVEAGRTGTIVFTADIPGVFEVELESNRIQLVELEIS